MTDERIKEEFENETKEHAEYVNEYGGTNPTWEYVHWIISKLSTAERLAKIEALEEVLKRWENMYCQDRESRETAVRSMIAELKEEGE